MTNYQLFAILVISCSFLSTTVMSHLAETVKWRCFHKNGSITTVPYDQAGKLVQVLDLNQKTLIYLHGYTESTDSSAVVALMNGFLAGSDNNIVAIDYRYITHIDYISAVSLAGEVADVVVNGIHAMIAAGLDKTKLILSGFSLGAQICGIVGRKVKPYLVPLILGIDPAGPGFTNKSLSASDGACVIGIHVDGGFYGTKQPTNHIDFYPNGGKQQQPGCTILTLGPLPNSCSHMRGELFTTEAARYPQSFVGVKCNSWDDFEAGKCNQNDTLFMGLETDCSKSGYYYLQTNSNPAYSRGASGTVYQKDLK
ncbi:lipase member H-like [Augochlora pura]